MIWFPLLLLAPLGLCASMDSLACARPASITREDQEIEAMLRNDPQVRLAEANLEKARAELVAARYDATLRILELKHKLEELSQRRAIVRESYGRMQQRIESGAAPTSDLETLQLEMVQIEGAIQSAELRLHQMG